MQSLSPMPKVNGQPRVQSSLSHKLHSPSTLGNGGTSSLASITLLTLLTAACGGTITDGAVDTTSTGGLRTIEPSGGSGGQAISYATGGMPPAYTGIGGGFPVNTGAGGSTSHSTVLPPVCLGVPIATSSVDAGAQCAGFGAELEPSPLDMYLMIDRSMSMTYTVQNTSLQRWDVLEQGITAFLNDPGVIKKATRVGLGFFGATGNPNDPAECSPNSYAQPKIEIQTIATGGPLILKAVTDEYALLGGQTPTREALWGALQHAQAWQVGNPRMTVVVLVTDGYPTECGNPVYTPSDMSLVTQVAMEYFTGTVGVYNSVGSPSIRSYIIGIAIDPFDLNVLAQAGGTGAATIVDNAGAVDEFVTAMVNITNANLQCVFTLPTPPLGQVFDPNQVQLFYKPFQGTRQQIPNAGSTAGCGGPYGGWYFDNPTSPATITLCPCTCANLGAGSIELEFGCPPFGIVT